MPSLDEAVTALMVETGLRLLDLSVAAEGSAPHLKVVVDTPQGITIGEITDLSRRIRRDAVVASALKTDEFRLEVTSPGDFFGLREPWQFDRHVGQRLKVTLAGDDSGMHQVTTRTGVLAGHSKSGIQLQTRKGLLKLPWQDIEQAVVLIDWQTGRKP